MCEVKVKKVCSLNFEVRTRLRQENGLFPLLFDIYPLTLRHNINALEKSLKAIKDNPHGLKIGKCVSVFAFVDDVILIASSILIDR